LNGTTFSTPSFCGKQKAPEKAARTFQHQKLQKKTTIPAVEQEKKTSA